MLPADSSVAGVKVKPSTDTSRASLVTTALIAFVKFSSVVSFVAPKSAKTPSTAVLASSAVCAASSPPFLTYLSISVGLHRTCHFHGIRRAIEIIPD